MTLAEGRAEGEPDHLVEAPGLLEGGGDPRPHEDPGPALELDVPRGLEVAVGRGHGVRVEPELPGEGPHRGQALAGREAPPEDLQLQLGQELVVEGNAAFSVEHDVHGRTRRS